MAKVRVTRVSVQYHEAIMAPLALYAVCVAHGVDKLTGKLNDDVTSPLFPHQRGLNNGLPMLGWVSRWNPEFKMDDWYCPSCAESVLAAEAQP